VTLHYQIEGTGETVLLLHPVGLDLTWWDSLAGALSAYFKVLRADLRGHGRSPTPTPPWRIEDFAADVHALLGARNLAPAHVVGLSLGGMVAQSLALDYPEDIRSLVLSGTASTFTPAARETLAARGTTAEEGGMEAVVEPTLERWFTPSFLGSDLRSYPVVGPVEFDAGGLHPLEDGDKVVHLETRVHRPGLPGPVPGGLCPRLVDLQ